MALHFSAGVRDWSAAILAAQGNNSCNFVFFKSVAEKKSYVGQNRTSQDKRERLIEFFICWATCP